MDERRVTARLTPSMAADKRDLSQTMFICCAPFFQNAKKAYYNKSLCSRSNRGCESCEKVGQALWRRGMKRCEQVFPVCWKVVEWTMGPKFSTPGSGKPLLNVEYYVEKVEFHIPFKIGRRGGQLRTFLMMSSTVSFRRRSFSRFCSMALRE